MRIIPAIDMIDGKCVRLSMGNYNTKKVYADDPLEIASEFEAMGAKYLHLVDLDGAKQKAVQNWEAIERICNSTSLQVDFGGGIRTEAEVCRLLEMGVNQLNIGSLAVKESDKLVSWMEKYEADKFILSVDLKDGMVATHGWMNTSNMSASEFISKYLEHGLKYVVSTDVAKDGMMSGPNFELYRSLVSEFPELKIIASGGVSKEEDILDLIPTGVDGVITGKAIYEGTLDLKKILANVN